MLTFLDREVPICGGFTEDILCSCIDLVQLSVSMKRFALNTQINRMILYISNRNMSIVLVHFNMNID
jgi:hypothetical protein